MSFTKSSRVWWNTTKPGAGTAYLSDADVPGTPDEADDSGIAGWEKDQLIVCSRSGFVVPLSEAIEDPYTGKLVWRTFVDKISESDQ